MPRSKKPTRIWRGGRSEFQIEIMKPRNHHLARSVHFFEPGGNWWEIESYELAVKAGTRGQRIAPLAKLARRKKSFPVAAMCHKRSPTALSRATTSSVSRRFYREVFGFDVVSPSPSVKPHYIKHPSTPWYIVSASGAGERRRRSSDRNQRFTLDTRVRPYRGRDAHRWLEESAKEIGDHRAHGAGKKRRRSLVSTERSG